MLIKDIDVYSELLIIELNKREISCPDAMKKARRKKNLSNIKFWKDNFSRTLIVRRIYMINQKLSNILTIFSDMVLSH